MRFRSTVELGGKTATGIEVPPEIVAALGSGKRPVVSTINGHTYRSTVAFMGGRYILPLSAEHREAASFAANDEVDVDVQLDTKPREVIVPADFAAELDLHRSQTVLLFDGMSYSNQRWHVLSVEGAETAETRKRRIDKSLNMLQRAAPAKTRSGRP